MLNEFYSRLPLLGQELLLTAYNSYVMWKKYGCLFHLSEGNAIRHPETAFDSRRALLGFLERARKDSPYYARVLPERRELESAAGPAEILSRLPLMPKSLFKEQARKIISRRANIFNSVGFRTSGTTGMPLTGRLARRDLRNRYVALREWFRGSGADLSMRWARFSGVDLLGKSTACIARRDLLLGHLFLSVYHMKSETVSQYHRALRNNGTQVLEGYPSAVATLAGLLIEGGFGPLRLEHVFTTAETLSDDQRSLIARVFGVEPREYYGSAEMSPLIVSGEDGLMRLIARTGLVELLDARDRPVIQPGQLGRLVVTSLNSEFMPLIRYDIGDFAEYHSGGVDDLILRRIYGRREEIVRGEDGRYVGRLSTALKKLPQAVLESQLRIAEDRVRLCYVAAEEVSHEQLVPFVRSITSKLGEVRLSIERVSEIQLGPHGKKTAVVVEK